MDLPHGQNCVQFQDDLMSTEQWFDDSGMLKVVDLNTKFLELDLHRAVPVNQDLIISLVAFPPSAEINP